MIDGKRFKLILLSFLIVFIFSGCGNIGLDEPIREDLKKIDYQISGFELKYYKLGELSWIFCADTVVVPINEEPEPKEETGFISFNDGFNTAEVVEISFFKDEELTSKLYADRGEYYVLSGNLIAEGNVVVESADKDKLLTSKLWWIEFVEQFWTDREVEIIRIKDNSKIRGIRLKSDRMLKDVRIDKHIETVIYKPKEKENE